jgi:hypothetical protein
VAEPARGPKPSAPPLFADEVAQPVAQQVAQPVAQPVARPSAAAPQASSAPIGTSTPVDNDPNGSLDASQPSRRAPRQGPVVPGRVAAAIAGLVAGVMLVGLTRASFALCDRIQGTDSCGGGGFFLLMAILVLTVVVSAVVLRLLGVGEPGSTSFMAVGLTSVVALLFLVDQLFEWWMVVAIPVVSVATFVLSQWVTATFVEEEPEVGVAADPEVVDHDVR